MLLDSTLPRILRPVYRYDSGAALLGGIFRGLTGPFLLVIARRLGASPLTISAMVAVPLAGTAYAAMLVEMYPDRARAGAMSRAKIEGMLATIVATMVAGQVMAGLHDYRLVFPAAAQVMQLGAYFFWGRWIDAHTPAQALVRGFTLLASASLVYLVPCTPWLSSNPTAWLLLPAAVLLGVGSGATELASVNCLFQLAPEGRAARYVSVHKGLVGIRGSPAPFVAVQLMHLAGWAGAFLTSVGLTMLGAALLSRMSSALFVAEQAQQAPQAPRVGVE